MWLMRFWWILFFGTLSLADPFRLTKVRDLIFPPTVGGALPAIVLANSGAELTFTAPPGTEFDISISDNFFNMTEPTGGHKIAVGSWSFSELGTQTMGPSGTKTIHVGATRGFVRHDHISGRYSGRFLVTVRSGGKDYTEWVEASMSVLASLSISRVSDLSFGGRVQGDPSKTVTPGGVGSASFEIQGEPNKQYMISLPSHLDMKAPAGGGNRTLRISAINTDKGATGTLPASGRDTLSVGGTLEGIAMNQVSGVYTGTLVISVTYQ